MEENRPQWGCLRHGLCGHLCVFSNRVFQFSGKLHVGAAAALQQGWLESFSTLTLMRGSWRERERSLWAFPRFVSDSFISSTLVGLGSHPRTHAPVHSKWSLSISLFEYFPCLPLTAKLTNCSTSSSCQVYNHQCVFFPSPLSGPSSSSSPEV